MIGNFLAADGEPVQRKDRILRMELARGQLVGLRDALDGQHARQGFEGTGGDIVALTDRTDNGLLDANDGMGR